MKHPVLYESAPPTPPKTLEIMSPAFWPRGTSHEFTAQAVRGQHHFELFPLWDKNLKSVERKIAEIHLNRTACADSSTCFLHLSRGAPGATCFGSVFFQPILSTGGWTFGAFASLPKRDLSQAVRQVVEVALEQNLSHLMELVVNTSY